MHIHSDVARARSIQYLYLKGGILIFMFKEYKDTNCSYALLHLYAVLHLYIKKHSGSCGL